MDSVPNNEYTVTVITLYLYDSSEYYLLVKRPLEESVAVSSHHHKEQRQVGAAAGSVSIQVDPQAHLVAVFTGIKGWKTPIKYNCVCYSLLPH